MSSEIKNSENIKNPTDFGLSGFSYEACDVNLKAFELGYNAN